MGAGRKNTAAVKDQFRKGNGGSGNGFSGQLARYVERIERLIEDRKEINADISAVKSEAKAEGFDTKTIMRLIKLRALTQDERDEQDALLDLYKGALGMLGDTPLGEAARRRASKPKPPRESDEGNEDGAADEADEHRLDPEDDSEAFTAEMVARARAAGRQAAEDGAKVLDNPYTAGDPRRAAWDEGWCAGAGSDGMDLPEAWRPTARKKKGDGDDASAGEGGQ